jgi:quinoprotein glucose dehydrogenase
MAGARPSKDAVDALQPAIASLVQSGPDAVRVAAAKAAAALKLEAGEALLAAVRSNGSAEPRVESLRALAALGDEQRLGAAVEAAQKDNDEALRREALKFQSQIKPSGAIDKIAAVLENGSMGEKQTALGTLGTMNDKAADDLLLAWLDKLIKGEAPKELQLDVIEAAGKRDNPVIKSKLQAYQAEVAKSSDPLAPYQTSLYGGNAADGKKIFFERAEAACVRCHKIVGQGSEGGEVGPELTHIGSKKDRAYILESIVLPNKQIAQGFETLLVTTKDGTSYAGVVKSENDKELVLNSPEDGIVKINKANITSRDRGLSAMPEGLATLLNGRELRDLVEFLANCK